MNTDKLNEIYEKYNHSFYSFFHTALWRILVDNRHRGKLGCFVVGGMVDESYRLGFAIANEPGYMPLPAYFVRNITYDMANDILDDINMIAFGLDDNACNLITISSMRGKPEQAHA